MSDVRITIRFGDESGDPELSETEELSFENEELAGAFMMGVEMASGWATHTVLRDSRDEGRPGQGTREMDDRRWPREEDEHGE
jgi:hypothetical protein